MKKITSFFTGIAIVFAMFLFTTGLMAQTGENYEINDGGTLQFNAGTYTGTVTSTTASWSSTAVLKTNGTVTLQGTYSNYYGSVIPLSGATLNLDEATFGSKFPFATDYSALTTISVINAGGVTFSGSAGANVITMEKYGAFEVQKDLTLTLGGIQLNSYSDANAPYIKFYPAATTPKITISEAGGTIKTDDLTVDHVGQIDASKHLYFDMTSAPNTSTGVQNFIIASFTATGDPTVTGTPSTNVSGDPDGVWGTYSVDVNSHNLRFNATYSPPFQIDATAGGWYKNNWSAMEIAATDGLSNVETLLKNYVMPGDGALSKSFTVDLGSYNLSGGKTITIASNKSLGFKGAGIITNTIAFGNSTAQLVLIGTISSGMLGSSLGGTNSGILKLGDGTITSTMTLDAAMVSKLNSKVSQVIVSGSATLTVTP